MFFEVRFRGEFGVLSDDASASLYETGSEIQLKEKEGRMRSSFGLTDLISVPYEDIRHLRALFPGGQKNKDSGVLSARLFSLKLDLKDA
jgi:hypothetical protein